MPAARRSGDGFTPRVPGTPVPGPSWSGTGGRTPSPAGIVSAGAAFATASSHSPTVRVGSNIASTKPRSLGMVGPPQATGERAAFRGPGGRPARGFPNIYQLI